MRSAPAEEAPGASKHAKTFPPIPWNIRHLVNIERIRKYAGIALANGYNPADLRSPMEVSGHGLRGVDDRRALARQNHNVTDESASRVRSQKV